MSEPATYLAYAKTHKERDVTHDLRALGINVWIGLAIEWERRGHDRRPKPYTRPVLPNYLFLSMWPAQFHEAVKTKHLASTMTQLTQAEVNGCDRTGRKGLRQYQRTVDAEYQRRDRARQAGEIVKAAFTVGEMVTLGEGPFKDKLGTFRGVIEAAYDVHPRLVLDVELFGRSVHVEADPLSVRRAS